MDDPKNELEELLTGPNNQTKRQSRIKSVRSSEDRKKKVTFFALKSLYDQWEAKIDTLKDHLLILHHLLLHRLQL